MHLGADGGGIPSESAAEQTPRPASGPSESPALTAERLPSGCVGATAKGKKVKKLEAQPPRPPGELPPSGLPGVDADRSAWPVLGAAK